MKNIVLFDYQKEMVKRVQETFRRSQSVMVQMPTGKTIVLANIVFSFLEKDKRDVWVVAHRRELVSQIEETFSKITSSLFIIKEGSTASHNPLSPQGTGDFTAPHRIRVMSIQWLTLHYQKMKEEPSLIVIDEAHHAVASTYAKVMRLGIL